MKVYSLEEMLKIPGVFVVTNAHSAYHDVYFININIDNSIINLWYESDGCLMGCDVDLLASWLTFSKLEKEFFYELRDKVYTWEQMTQCAGKYKGNNVEQSGLDGVTYWLESDGKGKVWQNNCPNYPICKTDYCSTEYYRFADVDIPLLTCDEIKLKDGKYVIDPNDKSVGFWDKYYLVVYKGEIYQSCPPTRIQNYRTHFKSEQYGDTKFIYDGNIPNDFIPNNFHDLTWEQMLQKDGVYVPCQDKNNVWRRGESGGYQIQVSQGKAFEYIVRDNETILNRQLTTLYKKWLGWDKFCRIGDLPVVTTYTFDDMLLCNGTYTSDDFCDTTFENYDLISENGKLYWKLKPYGDMVNWGYHNPKIDIPAQYQKCTYRKIG